MKKIFKIISLFLIIFIFPVIVKANTINKIDMDINIDDNGTAHVTEKWSASLDSGTEGYKPYYNIGNAKITNFKVSENKVQYKFQDNWNTEGSFKDKAYKNGINYISEGLELCFGISKYGNHEYTLNYDIEGFVATLTDADMIYWTLVPYNLSSKPENVHIKIYSNKNFSNELPVWGYGKYGATAYVYDGYIEMNSEGVLSSNEYMTILVKFDKGTFNTYNTLDNNFDYYHKMAEEGAVKYTENSDNYNSDFNTMNIVEFIFLFTIFAMIFLGIIMKAKNAGSNIGTYSLNFGKDGKKLPKDIPNVRDIPFDKDIYKTNWIAESYRLNRKKTDVLGAILLKWLMEKKIEITKVQTKKLFKDKEETAVVLKRDVSFENELETKLFNMMYEASKDGILETNEFNKWCGDNYEKILDWFDSVLDYQTKKYLNDNTITTDEITKFKVFTSIKYNVNESLKNEAIKLKGLKNFLEEFSRIDDREAIEVNLWEYYLIYAQILGIANKVAKQFKKLYPEIIENNQYGYSYDDFIFINTFSYGSINSAESSRARAESYSSGGGGFSSGGGGGGSFGGGSGGGGFR